MDTIVEECGKGREIKAIFKRMKQEGFKGKLTAFYSWFGKNFPDYKCKRRQTAASCKEMVDKKCPLVLFSTLSPRKIAIYVSNPEFGIDKNGIPGKEHSLIQQIIQSSPLLQDLKGSIIL